MERINQNQCSGEGGCGHYAWHHGPNGCRGCDCKRTFPDAVAETVNHPSHYNAHPSGVECITVVEHMTFNVGNAMKYLWRANHKNGVEDLRKAAWYVEREIKRVLEALNGKKD